MRQDPRWVEGDTRVPVRSLLSLPLFGGGDLLGVLNVSHPEPDHFDHHDERVFSVFCPIAGQFFWFARMAGTSPPSDQGPSRPEQDAPATR